MNTQTREFLKTLEMILLRCWVGGVVLLLLMVAAMLLPIEFHKQLHASWFGVLPHEFDLIIYCSIGLTKLLVIAFFFLPWLATKLTRQKLQ